MQKLVVIGNGISAELMYEYVRYDKRYQIQAFSADVSFIGQRRLFDLPIVDLETLREEFPPTHFKVLLAVGYSDLNRVREKLFRRVREFGYEALTYVHPEAKVFTKAIGEGSIILPNAFVDVYSEVGSNTVVWGNCSVAHHAKIGSHCWLATGSVVSASATISDNSFIGIGATVVNNIQVGKYNVIGANAMIAKDTNDHEVYITRQTEKFRLASEDFLRFTKI